MAANDVHAVEGSKRNLVVIAAMTAIFMAAVDTTIVNTAIPSIVGTLGGIAVFSWVFSAYLLTSTTTVPIYGKLADLYGRKRTFVAGASLFLLGSALSGQAHGMTELIVFRGLQGLGAGAVLPVTQTVIGDIFTVEQRARIQGIFSAVWGFAAIIGPALGGVIVDHLSWRWIFYLNLPIGLAAMYLMWRALDEPLRRQPHALDWTGVVSLGTGISALLFALLEGGVVLPWSSPVTLGLFALAGASLTFFVRNEGRAREPILPLELFRHRLIAVSNLASFAVGAVLVGTSAYLPLYAQGVQGGTATIAGAIVGPQSLAWTVGSVIAGRVILRMGLRASAVVGLALNAIGSGAVLVAYGLGGAPYWFLSAVNATVGLGMGFSNLAFILAVQNSVAWGQRGVATASILFIRNLGSTAGVSVMGTVLNLGLLSRLRGIPELMPPPARQADALNLMNQLLDRGASALASPQRLAALRAALAHGLFNVQALILAAALAGLVATFFLPPGRLDKSEKL